MTDAPDKPVSLAAARADKENDSRLWSVSDCLERALQRTAETDWTKCVLVFHRETGEKTFTTDFMIAGCSTLEFRGMLFNAIREEFFDFDGEP